MVMPRIVVFSFIWNISARLLGVELSSEDPGPGLTVTLLISSPITATPSGITMGNCSSYVPDLTNKVRLGMIGSDLAGNVLKPLTKAFVSINTWAVMNSSAALSALLPVVVCVVITGDCNEL